MITVPFRYWKNGLYVYVVVIVCLVPWGLLAAFFIEYTKLAQRFCTAAKG